MFEVQRRISNELQEIPALIDELKDVLTKVGLSDRDVFQIVLSLDEVLTNIVSYGFPAGGDHAIEIALHHTGDVVTVTVVDQGVPFDVARAPHPPDTEASLEQRSVGNLGIHIVKNFMDEVSYRRRRHQNHLVMKKTVSKAVH